jgi:hypothetical protein
MRWRYESCTKVGWGRLLRPKRCEHTETDNRDQLKWVVHVFIVVLDREVALAWD